LSNDIVEKNLEGFSSQEPTSARTPLAQPSNLVSTFFSSDGTALLSGKVDTGDASPVGLDQSSTGDKSGSQTATQRNGDSKITFTTIVGIIASCAGLVGIIAAFAYSKLRKNHLSRSPGRILPNQNAHISFTYDDKPGTTCLQSVIIDRPFSDLKWHDAVVPVPKQVEKSGEVVCLF
jgi:hypothetical protein